MLAYIIDEVPAGSSAEGAQPRPNLMSCWHGAGGRRRFHRGGAGGVAGRCAGPPAARAPELAPARPPRPSRARATPRGQEQG